MASHTFLEYKEMLDTCLQCLITVGGRRFHLTIKIVRWPFSLTTGNLQTKNFLYRCSPLPSPTDYPHAVRKATYRFMCIGDLYIPAHAVFYSDLPFLQAPLSADCA